MAATALYEGPPSNGLSVFQINQYDIHAPTFIALHKLEPSQSIFCGVPGVFHQVLMSGPPVPLACTGLPDPENPTDPFGFKFLFTFPTEPENERRVTEWLHKICYEWSGGSIQVIFHLDNTNHGPEAVRCLERPSARSSDPVLFASLRSRDLKVDMNHIKISVARCMNLEEITVSRLEIGPENCCVHIDGDLHGGINPWNPKNWFDCTTNGQIPKDCGHDEWKAICITECDKHKAILDEDTTSLSLGLNLWRFWIFMVEMRAKMPGNPAEDTPAPELYIMALLMRYRQMTYFADGELSKEEYRFYMLQCKQVAASIRDCITDSGNPPKAYVFYNADGVMQRAMLYFENYLTVNMEKHFDLIEKGVLEMLTRMHPPQAVDHAQHKRRKCNGATDIDLRKSFVEHLMSLDNSSKNACEAGEWNDIAMPGSTYRVYLPNFASHVTPTK